MTRDIVTELLNSEDIVDTINTIKVLMVELAVISLHGVNANKPQGSPKAAQRQATPAPPIPTPSPPKPEASKPSKVGTVSLPRPSYEAKAGKGRGAGDDSGSDIPSESSASSEDEGIDEGYAEELWKQALSSLHAADQSKASRSSAKPSGPPAQGQAQGQGQGRTHKDFFEALIKDIEQTEDYQHVHAEPHPEEKLALVAHLQAQIEEVVARVLAQAEYDYLVRGADDEDGLLLTGTVLDQIAEEVTDVLSPLTYRLKASAEQIREQLTEALSFLYCQPATAETRNLLLQAIELELHATVGEDGDDSSADSIDQGNSAESIASDRDVASNNRHDDSVQAHGELDADDDDMYTQEFEEVAEEEEMDLLNSLEMDQKDLTPPPTLQSPKLSPKPSPKGNVVYDDSSSCSSDHSPIPPSAMKAMKGVAKTPVRTPGAKGAADPTEGVPAWFLPKSPLDAVFRKGYGGLGQNDMQEVIDILTPHRPAPAADQEDLDEDLMAGHESDASSQGRAEMDSDEDEEDDDEDDIVGENARSESSVNSMRNNKNTYSEDNNYHYSLPREQQHGHVAEEEEQEFIGIDDLPDPDEPKHALRGKMEDKPKSGEFADRIRQRLAQYMVDTVIVKADSESLDLSSSSNKKSASPVSRESKGVLGKKASNKQTLIAARTAKRESQAGNILLEEAPRPEQHPVHGKSAAVAAFTKNPMLNAMMQSSFAAHVKQYAADEKGSKKNKVKKSKAKVVCDVDQHVYAYDEEEGDMGGSMDTNDYYAYVSSHSSSPIKEHAKEAKETKKKVMKKKRKSEPIPPVRGLQDVVKAPEANRPNSTTPKLNKSSSGPTKPTKSPSRPNSAGRVRSSSDVLKLQEPTAASKQRFRTSFSK